MKFKRVALPLWLFGASFSGLSADKKLYAYKYNGIKVYSSDMGEDRGQKFEAEYSQFRARVQELIEMDALDRFIKEEQQRLGFYLSDEDEQAFESAVSDEEVKEYYESNRNRLGTVSFERSKEHLRLLIQARREREMRLKVFAVLKKQGKLKLTQ